MNNEIEKLQDIFDKCHKIVFFTGAGVSTESGVPDFRSQDGLYNMKYDYPPEEILSHSFFVNKPDEFYRFYRDKLLIKGVKPNHAHYKMAEMEQKGISTGVITQNIDGLHSLAGSQHVVELHGTVHKNHCTRCGKFFDYDYVDNTYGVPKCDRCGSIIKPDVVLYEEGLNDRDVYTAIDWISQADCLVICGTSLVVYPAAGFVRFFNGEHLVIINLSETYQDRAAELVIRQPVGKVLEQIRV